MYIKSSGSWKKINEVYIKVSGAWKKVNEGYIKVSGAWKRFWSSALTIQSPVTISQSTNSTTYIITLTGTNYYWSPGPPGLTYYFEWSTNGGVSWTQLTSASAVNPSFGSSTSYTYQIASNQLSANVVNTYRFRVAATYGSLTGSSSATTTVQGPTNITDLTATQAGTSSINLSWSASTGANRYMIYYGTTSSPSTFSGGTSSTSATVSGLTSDTLYYFKVVPITGGLNNTGYNGNDSNIASARTAAFPGNITSPENYNFTGSNAQIFLTTGTNTNSVQYNFSSTNISGFSIGPFTQSVSSSTPYKFENNLLSYFTLKTWNADTYSSGTTYYLNNTVWYAGNQYRLTTTIYQSTAPYNEIGVSGQVPTNTTYWTKITTVNYNVADYVLYNGTYYICKVATNGTYPTNTAYWVANSATFTTYLTPYNGAYPGNQTNTSTTLIIRMDGANTDPLRISSGPTFSSITSSGFTTNFTPSVYTNQAYFYIQKVSDSSYPSGYNPKILSVSGATATSHTTQTALTASTAYSVYITARYVYNAVYGTSHTGETSTPASVSTVTDLPNPPTGLNVSDVGTNRPFNSAAYDLSWTAPSSGPTPTGYKIQYQVPSVGTTWYDWSANASDTSSTSIQLTGFGSNLSTNFRVYSVNSGGQSTTAVATSSPVLGTTVPQAPTIGTATSSNTYISVTYTGNATGGKAITTYTATSSPSSLTGTTSSGAIIVYSVAHNTAYTFTVTATNANGTSAASSSSNTAYGVNIGSVTNITSSATTSSITLNFTKATNSTGTRAYLSGSLDQSTSGTSVTFSGLSSGTSYSLGLAGTDTVNGILYVGPITSNNYSTASLPSTPTGFAATTNRTDGVNLTWNASSNTTSYEIYWNIVGGAAPSSGSPADFSGITSTSYLDTTIASNSSRDYYVRARNSYGVSAWSAKATGTRTLLLTSPTPTSVTYNGTQFNINFSGGSGPYYQGWYQTTSSLFGTDASSPDAAGSSSPLVKVLSASAGTTYYWWVRSATSTTATGTGNVSAWSGPVSVTIASIPLTPTGVGLTGSGVVSWTASTGATSYEIEFYTASNSSGANAAPTGATGYTVTGISGSPYQLVSPYGGTNANYARVRVRARNTAGVSAYSGWVPSATTYT